MLVSMKYEEYWIHNSTVLYLYETTWKDKMKRVFT